MRASRIAAFRFAAVAGGYTGHGGFRWLVYQPPAKIWDAPLQEAEHMVDKIMTLKIVSQPLNNIGSL